MKTKHLNPYWSAGLSRRQMLQASASGFGYLAFSALASAAAQTGVGAAGNALLSRTPHFPARAKRVIFLCMRGGPSHVDLYDYKPDLIANHGKTFAQGGKEAGAPKILGPVSDFVRAGKSGLWMSELFPQLAAHADDLCVINSMTTDLPNHAQAFGQMHTGSFQFVRPSLGAWSLYGLGTDNQNLPGFITLNPPADFGGARNYGNAFLPSVFQGTKIGGGQLPDLYAAFLGVDEEPGPPMKHLEGALPKNRQRAQLDFVQALNQKKLAKDQVHPEVEGAIESMELGFRMPSEVHDVLDWRSEPAHILERYGIGQKGEHERFARQCLLARRFAEAGVRFIEVTPPFHWDHHFLLRDAISKTCRASDGPIAALLTDLKERGMLQDTLVICAGEFGRTPYAQGIDGRDHNHKGFSLWMAGGGIKGGQRYGATDELGYEAVENPVHIHDWHATILHLLGLDHKALTFRYGGRSFRLTDVYGEVVKEIIA